MDTSQRIVITGLAPICGAGVGQHEVWDNILKRKLGLDIKKVVVNGGVIDEYYQHVVRKIDLSDLIKDRYKLNELRESLNQTQKKSLVEIEGHSVLYKDSHTWGDRDHFSMLCKAFLLHVGITGSERLKYDDSLAIMKNIIPDDC